jgi:sRNA-binding regulator protein Hfq
VIRKNHPRAGRRKFNQSSGDRKRLPLSRSSRQYLADPSVTGCESVYLYSLMESAAEVMVVLRQGEQISGRLAWYDQACLKLTPGDGSPGLIISKASIKYIYETAV